MTSVRMPYKTGPRPRIWIDGQCFQSASRLRGIGRAILETLTFLRSNHPHLDLHLSLNASHAEEAQTARHLLTPILGADRIHIWEGLVLKPESQGGYTDQQRASEAVLGHHIRSLAPDLIWSPSVFEGGHNRYVSLLAPKATGVPSVVTFHDAIPWRFQDRYLGDPVSRACYARHLDALAQYDLAFAVSPFSESELRDIHPGLPVINVSSGLSRGFQEIVDGLQPERAPQKGNETELLYVGGLDWRKNVRAILQAMGLLKDRGRSGIRLRLVGDQPGGDVEQLVALARELGIGDALDFTGFCTDAELIRAYQACDIAIQPSIMEGFGLTALEAMRAGAPLIAARAGALPGVVGDAALLFDPYDAVALADHIEAVIDDPALGRRLRRMGRQRCNLFDWEVTADCVARGFEGLVRPTRNTPRPVAEQRAISATLMPPIDRAVIPPARLSVHMAAAEVPSSLPTGRILFDVTSTFYNDYGTGIQRVVTRIARQLLENHPNVQLVVCDSDVGLEAARMDAKGRFRTERKLTRKIVYPQVGDTLILLDSSWIWYKSFETVLADARLRGAVVISGLHDLVPVAYPAYCDDGMPINFQKWLRAALRYSDAFICVSKATAKALHDLLSGTDFPRPMKIGHFRLGSDSLGPASLASGNPASGSARGEGMHDGPHDPDHFLVVGTLEPRKGHSDILAAFERLWASGADLRLTFVGRPGWGTTGLQAELTALAARDPRFDWISDADDTRLARAYADAGTVIAASHAEGFGLPLVEGGRAGCGVIARDIPVFREVAPGGTRFFDTVDTLMDQVLAAQADPTPPAKTDPPISWAESTALLMEKIRTDDYAQSYRPMDPEPFVPDTDTGVDRMKGPINPALMDISLSTIPTRIDSPLPGYYRFVVRVSNDGPEPLYSKGRLTGEDSVHLSYITLDHDGHERAIEAARAKIPYGLPRGQSTVMAIDLPDHLVENPAIMVQFSLVQEGRAWWPYLAQLDRDAHGIPAKGTTD